MPTTPSGPSHSPLASAPSMPSTPLATTPRPLKRAHTSLDGIPSKDLQAEFEVDVCKLFVSCGIAWNSADNPSMRTFMSKWVIPDVSMPHRRVLSGRVLDGEVKKVENSVRDTVKGKFATGQCDVWKNITKTPVISTVMTVNSEVSYPVNQNQMYTHIFLIESHVLSKLTT